MTFKEFAAKIPCLWLAPKLMQCSIEHVYDLVKAGKICYIKDGRNIRFRPEDLDDYEKRSIVRR
jgi:excisionase family DNA binding protein